jgi:hypothetical protein
LANALPSRVAASQLSCWVIGSTTFPQQMHVRGIRQGKTTWQQAGGARLGPAGVSFAVDGGIQPMTVITTITYYCPHCGKVLWLFSLKPTFTDKWRCSKCRKKFVLDEGAIAMAR